MTPEEYARIIVAAVKLTSPLSMDELRSILADAIRAAIQEESEACADLAGTIVKSKGWDAGERAWSQSDLNAANYTAELIAGEIRKRG